MVVIERAVGLAPRGMLYRYIRANILDTIGRHREALREFTDEIMDAITTLSEEAGDYWHSRRLRTRMAAWQDRNGLGRAKLRASLDARAQALRARLGR